MAFHLPVVQEDVSIDFVDADENTWRRSGYCCRCGDCCRGDPFNGTQGTGPVEGYCPFFSWESEGVGQCNGREGYYYSIGCNVFPGEPDIVAAHPQCTYRFDLVT